MILILGTLRGVIEQFCRYMDKSEEWKHSVPGADQGFELEIDATTFRKFKLRSKRSALAYFFPLHNSLLRLALINVYGARLLLTMEAHSTKLPFVAHSSASGNT